MSELIVLNRPSPPDSDLNARRRLLYLCLIALCILGAGSSASAKGELSASQARKLIARMAGFELKTNSVHVSSVRSIDATTIEASADITTAFRLEQSEPGRWRVLEFRTGQDQWQGIEFIKIALKLGESANPCDTPEIAERKPKSIDVTNKRARCLLADLLGVQLPSEDVRIKAISSMTLPFSSKPSAMVEALVGAEFRFQRQSGSWAVSGLKTGNRDWVDPTALLNTVNEAKSVSARAELEAIVKALEAFRAQRGYYVEAKSEAVLVDSLSPQFLTSVIRLDPWRRPYLYEGTRDHFALSSLGADGRANTSDDIVLIGLVRSANR